MSGPVTREQVVAIVQQAFDSLKESDLISKEIEVNEQTVLLGPNTQLDSIAFVTFMVEVEDRLQAVVGDDSVAMLAINEIHDFNPDKSRLTVGVIVDFIMHSIAA